MKVLSLLVAVFMLTGLSSLRAEDATPPNPATKITLGLLKAKPADAQAGIVAVLERTEGRGDAVRVTEINLLATGDDLVKQVTDLIGKRVAVTGVKSDAGLTVSKIEEHAPLRQAPPKQ